MPLRPSEIDQVKTNAFVLDALEMRLVRNGDETDSYTGPGCIRQKPDGTLELTIYDRGRVPPSMFSTPELAAGTVIPHEHFYSLEARDLTGRTWRAERILPDPDGVDGESGLVCRALLDELICSEQNERASRDSLWMFIPGTYKVPANVASVVEEHVGGKRQHFSTRRNVWQLNAVGMRVQITATEEGLEVQAHPESGALPGGIDMRLQEALWLVLARPVMWHLLVRTSPGHRQFRIRRDRGSSASRLAPPLELNHRGAADALGRLFGLYLQHILPFEEKYHHPTSVSLRHVLTASAAALEAEALSLGIAVESILRRDCAELGRESPEFRAEIDRVLRFLDGWDGDPGLKDRVRGNVGSMKGVNPRHALQTLQQLGVVSEAERTAWVRVRNTTAHGNQLHVPIVELMQLRSLTHMALLRIIFYVLGYTGPYTDRSQPGWPVVEFAPGCSPEKSSCSQ